MPVENTATKGNLFMTFDIQFPTQFQLETKQRVIEALKSNEETVAVWAVQQTNLGCCSEMNGGDVIYLCFAKFINNY